MTGELTGDTESDFVTVDDDCTYEWSGSFIDAATKASCQVAGPPEDDAEEDTPDAITFTVAVENCAEGGLITVTVSATPTSTTVETCTADDITNLRSACATADSVLGESVKSTTHKYDTVSRGAVKETTFVVSADPASSSHPACQPASGETKVNNAGKTQVKLFVVGGEAIVKGDNTVVNCAYDVEVAVPAGFDAKNDTTNKARAALTVAAPVTEVNPTLTVATRKVYLIQNVDGDAGGAYATYRLDYGDAMYGRPAITTEPHQCRRCRHLDDRRVAGRPLQHQPRNLRQLRRRRGVRDGPQGGALQRDGHCEEPA